ncbi:alkaline phosphatase PhoX [Spectribacter hydrogenooxidans]|uniref:DUF839 domain-containing protein n=1 Tax=Spectribacter hydrogenoxidans TaxID=3075608 RepID=A0ABU3BVY9_9GAMM|nr:alkaline phosphatase PhoX [Salinisphaera sp. W335]MDT0633468.1 DUF839 domain-containing protein [Salinisphaera sp. W335]
MPINPNFPRPVDPVRRRLLLGGLSSAGVLAVGPVLSACGGGSGGGPTIGPGGSNSSGGGGGTIRPARPASNIANVGALQAPDTNSLRLPMGFSSRVIARADEDPTGGSGYRWHTFPDGGATFEQPDGGWVYVCNSEFLPGGVGALRFDAAGNVIDAYQIQRGTLLNCAGGPTPWGTWLTCEEYEAGFVYECDPGGQSSAARLSNQRPAMGTFAHEAAAIDPVRQQAYLTEDESDGGFYRFTPDNYPDLSSGLLEIAEVLGNDPATRRQVIWHEVPDPNPTLALTNELNGVLAEIPLVGDLTEPVLELIGTPTRRQVANSSVFDGGEGIAWHDGIVYFTTKGDNRVWALDTAEQTIEIIYDDDLFADAVLTGVDNVAVSAGGDVLVAEDGGDMQIVAITPERQLVPLVMVVDQAGSEVTGPAFSPDGTRLYFNSQRGPAPSDSGLPIPGPGGRGLTYEITGPFFDGPIING